MLIRPSNVEDALLAGRAKIRKMARFDLDEGAIGIWNETYDLVYEGVTYYALGPNLLFGSINSQSDLSSAAVSLLASGCAPTVNGIISGISWHQRPAVLQIAYMDDAGDVMHIEPKFSGFLDYVAIEDAANKTSDVAMTIESNNREMSRANGRVRSDSDQRRVDATDTFFEHTASSSIDDNIYWMQEGPQPAVKQKSALRSMWDSIF